MNEKPKITMEYKTVNTQAIANPNLWGSAFWFTLHNGSAQYPKEPSNIVQNKMKFFIKGLSCMIPCQKCAIHAEAYISENLSKINNAVKTRDSLFEFFCDFHNFVNKRLGKAEIPFEELFDKYRNPTEVEFIQFHYN